MLRPLIALLLLVTPMHAALDRGVWFWGNTTTPAGPSPYGSSVVVGDAAAEDETISFFTSHAVKRVYGSYQNRPVSEPTVIADWNLKLNDAGVQSQLLLSGYEVNDPVWVADLLDKVQDRFIDFNDSYAATPGKQFDALHLDLEPQGLSDWDISSATRRALLDDLADTYTSIRTLLDDNGYASIPIYADIPFFWDKLPADGGSVAWADAADRDSWFAAIGASLTGVSVMTFSKDNVPALEDATLYERTGSFPGFARIAIQPKGWPGEMWPSILHFYAVLNGLELTHAPDYATDIENYAFWRYSIATTGPVIGSAVEIDIELSDDPGVTPIGDLDVGPVIIFPGEAGYTYSIKSTPSIEPDDWRSETSHEVDAEGGFQWFRIPVPPRGPRSFYRLEVAPTQAE